jgi:hypothetical protein
MGHFVAVVGPGDDAAERILAYAAAVGRLLAEAGCVVVTGGGAGVMAAAAEGAAAEGGTVLGVLPGDRRDQAIGPVTIALPTGLGELRNGLVVRTADAVIAVGGSWGTASEVALAMRTGVPVVSLAGWRFADESGQPIPMVVAATPEEAASLALDAIAAK